MATIHKRLKSTEPEEYILLGVATQLKETVFCFHLMNSLQMKFTWACNTRPGLNNNQQENTQFPIFQYENEAERTSYFMIANKRGGTCLIDELKNADYLLLIKGNLDAVHPDNLMAEIKKMDLVQAVFRVNPKSIKDKSALEFEITNEELLEQKKYVERIRQLSKKDF